MASPTTFVFSRRHFPERKSTVYTRLSTDKIVPQSRAKLRDRFSSVGRECSQFNKQAPYKQAGGQKRIAHQSPDVSSRGTCSPDETLENQFPEKGLQQEWYIHQVCCFA